jgi:predicted nucleotidyltransferase component of viral defense system
MESYKNQVALLLKVLPEVAKEECFALHGGTAINLFVRNMPRLSVDIDLTYIPLEGRTESFEHINTALKNIEERIRKVDSSIKIVPQEAKLKLQIQDTKALIKVEVNQGIRGLIGDIEKRELCEKTEEQFDAFCLVPCVPLNQLYGGKICAALDRQHPRDLFDVKYLLENEGFTEDIKTGFLFCLLSSKRPIIEMLYPSLINQEQAYKNQFVGMTEDEFSYEDFESTRTALIETIHNELTTTDKQFIVSFENATPDWELYNFADFPAVKWKLQNLAKLKSSNPDKHNEGIEKLKLKLDIK